MVIAEALNRDLFARYLALEFPGRPTAVRFALSNTRKPTASEVADLAVKLKGAGYSVVKAELEEKVGLPLVKDEPEPTPFGGHFSANKQPVSTHPNSGDGKTPVNIDETPVKIAPQGSGGQGDGSGAEGLKRLVEAFSRDLAPAAEEVKALLAGLDAGKDVTAAAASLVSRLPSLLPADPEGAAILADAMAKAAASVPGASAPSPTEKQEDEITQADAERIYEEIMSK